VTGESQKRTQSSGEFPNVNAALQVFRRGFRGQRGPRWHAAAEYMIANANYDTQMLIDYVIERTRSELGVKPARPRRSYRWLWWLSGGIMLLALIGGVIYAMILLYQQINCR